MEIISGSRKSIVDKADMWLDAVIPSHTNGKRGKSREAVPTQAAWQPFSPERLRARGVLRPPEAAQLQKLTHTGF